MRGREARMIENRLRMHAEYMRRLMATGLDLETASARAYAMVKAPGSKYIEPGSAPDDGYDTPRGRTLFP